VRSGYVVDGVEQIYRMPWTSVRPAPDVHSIDTSRRDLPSVSSCTGVVEMNDRLVLMLDFESVADAILLDDKLHLDAVDNPDNIDRRSFRVVLAEDSPFMRDLLHRVLTNSGYTRAEVYANGAEAWQAISTTHHADPIHAVVSDIEMPQMDGLHLCKRIRAHGGDIAGLPVVLFSSLISEDNRKKGAQVGATIQISKPNLAEVVTLVDRAVTGRLSAEQPAA
jgi:two-component system chemotaxis response regulator CheV